MVGCHDFGLDGAVRNSRLLLALPSKEKEAVRSVQGEEDTRGAPHVGPVAREIGIGEQPELRLVWRVPSETKLSPGS